MKNVNTNSRNQYMLTREPLANHGYDTWWHTFTGREIESGEKKAFFIGYFLMNPSLSEHVPLLGQAPESKELGQRPSYVMVKAGAFSQDGAELNDYFSFNEVQWGQGNLKMTVGPNYLSETRLYGAISISEYEATEFPEMMTDAGSMSWDLSVWKPLSYSIGRGASLLARMSNAYQSFWHVEGMQAQYEGIVTYNDLQYRVEKERSYGYQDKNWGTDFTSPWIKLNSNCIRYKDAQKVLAETSLLVGADSPILFGKQLNSHIIVAFTHLGRLYEFNETKFWTGAKTKYKFSEYDDYFRWQIIGKNNHSKIEIDFRCKKSDLIALHYENPNGSIRHERPFNGKNAKGVIRLYEKKNHNFELMAEFDATHAGCEFGTDIF